MGNKMETITKGYEESQLIDNSLDNKRDFVDFRMVTFSLGGKEYGIDIMYVKEISRVNDFTYIPNSAKFVRGVYNLRGEIISVMDLRSLFSIPPKVSKDGLEDLLVLNSDESMVGVIVDTIDRVVGVSSSKIQPPHPFFAEINISFIKGVVEVDGRLYVILDVERILATGNVNSEDTSDSRDKDSFASGIIPGMGYAKKTISIAEANQIVQSKVGKSSSASQDEKAQNDTDANQKTISHDALKHSVEYVSAQQSQADEVINLMRAEAKAKQETHAFLAKREEEKKAANGSLLADNNSFSSASNDDIKDTSSVSSSPGAYSNSGSLKSAVSFSSLSVDDAAKMLHQFNGFVVSKVNRKWVEDKLSKKSYSASNFDSAEFLSDFYSNSTNEFWSEVLIDEFATFLPEENNATVYALDAGCGEGYESYSLAVAMMERYDNLLVRIWAQDTDLLAVSMAPTLDLEGLQLSSRFKSYLENGPSGQRFIKRVADCILFEYHDLTNENVLPDMDIIVARDFLSFINANSCDSVVNDFVGRLKSGCHIIIGDNEEIFHPDLEKVKSSLFNVYKKKQL